MGKLISIHLPQSRNVCSLCKYETGPDCFGYAYILQKLYRLGKKLNYPLYAVLDDRSKFAISEILCGTKRPFLARCVWLLRFFPHSGYLPA